MLDDPMESSDENTKEVDQSSQEQFIEKTLAESLEEYYKLIDEKNQNTLNNDQNVLEKVDILSTQKAKSLETSEENNKNLEDSEKSLELTGESTEISNLSKKTSEIAPENAEKNSEITEQNAEHAVKNMEDSGENLQGMPDRTDVPRPVTVRRTMYRPSSVFRRPIVRRTAIIERSPIFSRTIILPVASPIAPNSTPATVVKRPAVTPVASPTAPNSTPATVVTKPAVTKPAVTKPAVTKPAVTKSAVTKPAVTKPAVTKQAVTKPAVTKPAVTKPAATKPAVTKPAVTKPAATKPAVTKPAATKPAVTKPAATKPAVSPAPVIHRTTIINPTPAVRRQTIIHQSSPSCRAGFYWAWTNPKIRSGKCVKDYENNCEEYSYDHGMCHKCFAGFIKTKTQYGDDFCLKQGATMPDLSTLRKGDKAYNKLHRDSSMTWFIWLLVIVVMLIVIGIITRCICNKRKAENIAKGIKIKDLDSAEFFNMGEPNSPF